ncbi:Isoflavone 2'-hydroxylase [Apostasia shenzhenica]|uniref:Isoflavone 2'-hydroxylase n=1 Tax=Apostasia shenzhenica TaxID=1088818 RepID=A0A2I0AWG5_9ASPA|nr:Isoflavone 2'-hydroxylase [Apostasia shenzhenica]
METAVFLSFAVLLLSALILLLGLRRRNLPPTVPGGLPIFGHLLLLGRQRQPLHRALADFSAAHGPSLLLRFASLRVLLISSPFAAGECLNTNDVAFANRPFLLAGKFLAFDYSSVGVAPYGPYWRDLRRILTAELLSPSRLQSFAGARADEVCSLLRCLFSQSTFNWFEVEMRQKLTDLTFNTVMRMIDGKRYHGETLSVTAENGRRFQRIVQEVFRLSGAACLEDYLPAMRWLGLGGMTKRMKKLGEEMDVLFQGMVDERRLRRRSPEMMEEKEEKTIVDVMLELQQDEPAQPGNYSDKVIKGMISGIILAGTDTSASTVEWALSLLLNHPEALQKAREEIDGQIGHDHLISDSDLHRLPYLHNVVKETLRLFPAAPLLLAHHSSRACTIQGYGEVPGGTMLLINAYAIHRDPRWWKEAERFKPERFEEGEELGGSDQGFRFLPFGSGRRRCPGEALAHRMMGLALGALIQCFEWERVGKELVDLREGEGLTMPKLIPLKAMCRPRQVMINVLSHL